MTLIIRDVLLNPPTWFSSFRDLTLYCHVFLRIDCVIETEDADPYYRWIKWRGGMDFVEDLCAPAANGDCAWMWTAAIPQWWSRTGSRRKTCSDCSIRSNRRTGLEEPA